VSELIYLKAATASALVTVAFPFDDEPAVNPASRDELTVSTFGSSDFRRLSVPT